MERIMDFHNCWSAPNLLPHPTTWWHNGHKSLPAPPLFPRSSTTHLPGYSEVIFISFQRRTNLTHEEQLLDSGWCYPHLWLPWPVNPWIKSFIGFSSSSSIRVTRGPGTYLSNWSQWTSGKSKDLHCVGPEFHEIWGTKHCPPWVSIFHGLRKQNNKQMMKEHARHFTQHQEQTRLPTSSDSAIQEASTGREARMVPKSPWGQTSGQWWEKHGSKRQDITISGPYQPR